MAVEKLTLDRMPSPLGEIFIVTDDRGRVRVIEFGDDDERMTRMLHRHCGVKNPAMAEVHIASATRQALEHYFAGNLHAIDELRVEIAGTEFQRAVWSALRAIPVGATISYGELARRIGRPNAARAVGMANGANPIAIVVPCHRVVGADGSLTGYGGGLERKRWLLAHERAEIARFRKPEVA